MNLLLSKALLPQFTSWEQIRLVNVYYKGRNSTSKNSSVGAINNNSNINNNTQTTSPSTYTAHPRLTYITIPKVETDKSSN